MGNNVTFYTYILATTFWWIASSYLIDNKSTQTLRDIDIECNDSFGSFLTTLKRLSTLKMTVCRMLDVLIENIFVMFNVEQTVIIQMGIKCRPHIGYLFFV